MIKNTSKTGISDWITDAMMWFDKFSCKRSDLVITVGRDLVETVEKRFKGKKVPKTVMINNWIDENEIYPLDESNEKVLAFKKKYGLDVFPMDYLPADDKKLKQLNHRIDIYRKMLVLKSVPVSDRRSTVKNWVLKVSSFLLKPISMQHLISKIAKLATSYNDDATCNRIADSWCCKCMGTTQRIRCIC